MSRDYVELGPVPCNEDCAQVGDPNYMTRTRAEAKRYIALLTAVMGEPPEGAWLGVKAFPHDFGTYHEVVCYFDDENEDACTYAYRCEDEGPQSWDDTHPRPATKPSILAKYIREE